MAEVRNFTRPQEIVEAGEKIYAEKYKQDYERNHPGKFAALDVLTGTAYVAEFPEDALQQAREKAPSGLFHLIKIGSPGAFRVSYHSPANANSNWLF